MCAKPTWGKIFSTKGEKEEEKGEEKVTKLNTTIYVFHYEVILCLLLDWKAPKSTFTYTLMLLIKAHLAIHLCNKVMDAHDWFITVHK